MIESQNIRQILAIMVTDIVDYTETMNNDEDKAWEYLKKQRTLIPPMISKMNGHIFKEMGDGTFSKFKSAIDAVHCAVKILEEATNNELPIRISVHLGDVMDDGVDVIGTGVNIASRINSLAKTGSIVISEDVWRQVRNQADLDATSMGQKEIKGFHQTVEVFDLTYNPDGSITQKVKVTETVTITDEDGKKVQAEAAKKEFIKKIAIFPFDYNGEDKTYDYLKYGFPFGCCVSLLQDPLVEIEFPNDMELDGWIFNYKLQKAGFEKVENVPLPLKKKIAKELHCNYFVSGNINVVENKIHIISKVYETKNGKQINENKIENTNLFQLIDNYSIQIRKDMGISNDHIEQNENLSIADITTESLDAYKDYINGIVILLYQNDYNISFKLFQSATKDDPTFVLGNFSLFWCSLLSNNEEYQKESDNAMTKAINHIYKLPPRLSYTVKVIYYLIHKGDEDKAQKVVKMWIKQFPESLAPLNRLARLYKQNNRRPEAINTYEKIKQKDPDYINTYYELQECYLAQEDYDNALKNAEIYMKHCPTDAASYIAIGDINYKKGEYEEAKDYYEQALMLESNSSDCMRKIADAEYAVGNFTEAEEQLNDALTFCKNNQDYYIIFDAQRTLYENCGRIKESIVCNEKTFKYLEKFQNPVDMIINRASKLRIYVCIDQTDLAITKLQDEISKLVSPWNLLAGIGEIVVGQEAYNKDLVDSGVSKMENFLKVKTLPWLRNLPNFGIAISNMIEENYDNAIDLFTNLLDHFGSDERSEIKINLIKCYSGKKDYESAITIGIDHLIKDPFNPLMILEVAKAYQGNKDIDNANRNLTKLLGIWDNADEEYIYYKEAKKLWKELNTVKEPA